MGWVRNLVFPMVWLDVSLFFFVVAMVLLVFPGRPPPRGTKGKASKTNHHVFYHGKYGGPSEGDIFIIVILLGGVVSRYPIGARDYLYIYIWFLNITSETYNILNKS